ncbi:hypothetical protein NECAME_07634 [Necator americanus]|uniref:Uncharacterized protein n=1 Tax=Necator americanus TaxID=51031 RepID=W2TLK1_NECAM|nr:hypothetical protein NECAME_07634 [Necator americanus]ETN82980.1 hypothetical protein NECAME_07634 [Necator americanus]
MTSLNAKQKLALLNLYSEEIMKRLTPIYYCPEMSGVIAELLDINRLEELCMESYNEDDFSKRLWDELAASPMKNVLYDTILNYLSKVDASLHSILCLVSEKDTRSQFGKVLSNFEQFWTHINADTTMAFLKKIPCYDNIIMNIERSWRGSVVIYNVILLMFYNSALHILGDEEEDTKKRIVLRTIPLLGSNAIYDLMRSIYDNSEKAAAFVDQLHPCFLRYYGLNVVHVVLLL